MEGPSADKVQSILKGRAGGGSRRPEHQIGCIHGDHGTWVMAGPGVHYLRGREVTAKKETTNSRALKELRFSQTMREKYLEVTMGWRKDPPPPCERAQEEVKP